MHIRTAPLSRENLALCDFLWGDRLAYSDDDRCRTMDAAAFLLDERRALGSIIFEGDRPKAFGLSTFVAEPFIQEYLSAPHPQIGKRLLLGTRAPRSCAVLNRAEIGQRNAGNGLELVIANTAYDPNASTPDAVIGQLMAAFQDRHRGYRIARITIEVFGEAAIKCGDGVCQLSIAAPVRDLDG